MGVRLEPRVAALVAVPMCRPLPLTHHELVEVLCPCRQRGAAFLCDELGLVLTAPEGRQKQRLERQPKASGFRASDARHALRAKPGIVVDGAVACPSCGLSGSPATREGVGDALRWRREVEDFAFRRRQLRKKRRLDALEVRIEGRLIQQHEVSARASQAVELLVVRTGPGDDGAVLKQHLARVFSNVGHDVRRTVGQHLRQRRHHNRLG